MSRGGQTPPVSSISLAIPDYQGLFLAEAFMYPNDSIWGEVTPTVSSILTSYYEVRHHAGTFKAIAMAGTCGRTSCRLCLFSC